MIWNFIQFAVDSIDSILWNENFRNILDTKYHNVVENGKIVTWLPGHVRKFFEIPSNFRHFRTLTQPKLLKYLKKNLMVSGITYGKINVYFFLIIEKRFTIKFHQNFLKTQIFVKTRISLRFILCSNKSVLNSKSGGTNISSFWS